MSIETKFSALKKTTAINSGAGHGEGQGNNNDDSGFAFSEPHRSFGYAGLSTNDNRSDAGGHGPGAGLKNGFSCDDNTMIDLNDELGISDNWLYPLTWSTS